MATVIKSDKYTSQSLGRASEFGLSLPFNISSAPAEAIYSLRRVRHAYVGPAALVYQATTAAYGTLAFDANDVVSGSSLVTITVVGTSGYSIGQQVTLTAFAAAADVRVTTWYDQMARTSRDLICSASPATRGPRLYIAGVLQATNGKPNLVCDGTDDFMQVSFSRPQPHTMVFCGVTPNVTESVVLDGTPYLAGALMSGDSAATPKRYISAGTKLGDNVNDKATNRCYVGFFNGASSSMHSNGALVASGNAGSATATDLRIGYSANNSPSFATKYWEVLCYSGASPDIDGISADCMAFYGL
jgi:hypothetical protein